MKKNVLSTILVLFLLITLPISTGAELFEDEDYEEYDTGESIVVNVKSYEPSTVTSNLLFDSNVPVYAFLEGYTVGTIIGSENGLEPIYGGITIDSVKVRPINSETEEFLSGDIDYYRPKKISADNLGYLELTLEQLNTEELDLCNDDSNCESGYQCDLVCIPETLNLSLSAEIWFSEAKRLYSLSKTSLVLPEDTDESDWEKKLSERGAMYSFFGGRGLIRVNDISSGNVQLTVYSNKDLYWPIIGAPREIADIELSEGETSEYIDLGTTDEAVLGNAKFRLTLSDIKDPSQERAWIRINVGGDQSELVVTEGSSLFPGSSWTVNDINYGALGREGVEQSIVIKDQKGNKETITTVIGGGLTSDESDLLNRKFYSESDYKKLSSAEKVSGIKFTSSTQSLGSVSVGDLDTLFRPLLPTDIKIDTSEVDDETTKTKPRKLQSEVSVKDLLISILPSGYYYSVKDADTIEIKEFQSTDPCVRAELYEDGDLPTGVVDQYNNQLLLDVGCTAIEEYKQVIKNYDGEVDPKSGESIADHAYLGIAETYRDLADKLSGNLSTEEIKGAKELELEAYQELVDRESVASDDVNFAQKVAELESDLIGDIVYGSETIEDNGRFVFVKLLSVEELQPEDLSSVEMTKEGVKDIYYVGSELFSKDISNSYGTYNWEVFVVEEDYVKVKKVYSVALSIKAKPESDTIKLGKSETIEGVSFSIRSIDTKKEAHITVTPGTGGSLRSKSNFTVHIPIEKRSLQLNPEKIDDKIARAKALQEKISAITETLDGIVKTWNKICLGVFAYVTVKSSFFGKSADARHDAIHGIDGESGWHAYCQEESVGTYSERKYNTYDDCMQANADKINDDIETAQEAKEYVEKLDGDYQGEGWYDEWEAGYGGHLTECQELIGDDVFLDDKSLAEYAYLKQLEDGVSDNVQSSVSNSLKGYDGENAAIQEAKQRGCNNIIEAIDNGEYDNELKDLEGKALDDKKKEIVDGFYQNEVNAAKLGGIFPESKTYSALHPDVYGDKIEIVGKVFKSGHRSSEVVVYTENGAVKVKPLDLYTYNQTLGYYGDTNSDVKKDLNTITSNAPTVAKTASSTYWTTEIVASTGSSFYIEDNGISSGNFKIYVGTPAYSTGEINEEFADNAKLEIYGSGEFKGLPYCLPHENGNFIKILDYNKIGEIDTMQYWNVGPDGQLCSIDDVLVEHQSELEYSTASPSKSRLASFAEKYIKMDYVEGEIIKIDSHPFIVSFGKSKIKLEGADSSCYDVMDAQDCKLMFNVCDPVMCPPSRFNLNGRWQVDNVVESGIIGSVVLGVGTGDAVPVCMTGVLANMKWWDSMLDGYVDCLEAAKFEGDTVGICDKTRSVYRCELLVREVVAIMDYNKFGLLDFLAEKAYSTTGGGGEYFHFKENIQNMQNAVTYFTTDYANTAFASFKGRSIEEVGTEICRQAIYKKLPWFQDFMSQITTPEDPNQFFATLKVKPYAPSLGLEAYQLYYHIYAGNNANIDKIVYQVYLRNSKTGETYDSTETCGGGTATLEMGGTSDQTVDCVTNEGLDEVCVVVNGETTCGFGSVTTSFAADFIKDSLVADEIKRNIDSEEECYPSVSVASPSVSEVGSLGLTSSLVLPYSYGILETGVQRVCSINNPGAGQGDSGDWAVVGTCGKDADGRILGSCWLNEESYSLRDAKKSEEIDQYLKDANWNYSKTLLGVDEDQLLNEEQSAEAYDELLDELSGTDCKDKELGSLRTLPSEFRLLEQRSTSYTYAALAQQQIGNIYSKIMNDCELRGRGNVNVDLLLDNKDIKFTDKVPVEKGSVTFTVVLSNLQSDDIVVGSGVSIEPSGDKTILTFNCGRPSADGESECKTTVTIDEDLEYEYTVDVNSAKGEEVLTKVFKLSPSLAKEISSSTSEVVQEECSQCVDSWMYSITGGCDVKECHSNSEGCYFDDTGIDECNACANIYDDYNKADIKSAEGDTVKLEKIAEKMCNELNVDETRCEESECYDSFLDDLDVTGYCELSGTVCGFKEGVKSTSRTSSSTSSGDYTIGDRLSPGNRISDISVSDLGVNVVETNIGPTMKGTPELENAIQDWVKLVREKGFEGDIGINDMYRKECDKSLHCTGNAVDLDTNPLNIDERLIWINAAMEVGFGEIYHGQENKIKGVISNDDNLLLKCWWLGEPDHYNHLHLALEERDQPWESCAESTSSGRRAPSLDEVY